MEDDKWMTCFRDGRDESEMGYRAVAFSYGQDGDQRRRFKRFQGSIFGGRQISSSRRDAWLQGTKC